MECGMVSLLTLVSMRYWIVSYRLGGVFPYYYIGTGYSLTDMEEPWRTARTWLHGGWRR